MKKAIYILSFFFVGFNINTKGQSNLTSLQFDGIDDYINFGDPLDGSLDFSSSESFTFITWIKTTSVPSTYESIVFKRRTISGVHYEGYILAVNSSGTIYFVVEGTNDSYSQMNGNINVADGNWHCIAASRDVSNDNINIYVDGVLDVTMADNTTATLEGSMNFYIGRWDYYGRHFNGKIDEVSVWNYALSTTDISNYMNCPPNGNESNLISYWKLDEGSGNIANESSTNSNNDGTLQNNPTWSSDYYPYPCQLSISENTYNLIDVYPNPAITTLTFELTGINNPTSYLIYDAIGKIILTDKLNGNTVDISNLSSGIYHLEITSEGKIYRQKFIKQ